MSSVRTPTNLKPGHWSKELKEVTLVTQHDGMFNFRVVGGSDHGEFPVVVEVMPPDTRGVEYVGEGDLTTQDVLLEVQGQKVAGYTQADVVAWLGHCSRNGNPVVLRTAPQGKTERLYKNNFLKETTFGKQIVNSFERYYTEGDAEMKTCYMRALQKSFELTPHMSGNSDFRSHKQMLLDLDWIYFRELVLPPF